MKSNKYNIPIYKYESKIETDNCIDHFKYSNNFRMKYRWINDELFGFVLKKIYNYEKQ